MGCIQKFIQFVQIAIERNAMGEAFVMFEYGFQTMGIFEFIPLQDT